MYILSFGGSWLDHTFWRGNFLIEKPEVAKRVRESGVPFVLIDEERGIGVEETPTTGSEMPARTGTALLVADRAKPVRRPISTKGDREMIEHRNAIAIVSRAKKLVGGIFEDASLGRAVNVASVESIVGEIADSVAYSPQTLLGITRLKNKDEYTYLHSLSVCTLMVTVAQHLSMDHSEVLDLGLAGLLHDIGKVGIPEHILNKPDQLTDDEFQNVRDHPEHGYLLLCTTGGISPAALDVCRHHHEKIDGTGYPFGLSLSSLSFAARLGAICDVYDALTSNRAYKEAWSTERAISEMWHWEGHFDKDILFTFMQAVELYPPGMLVKLSSNRLAIILKQRPWRTRPHALSFYSVSECKFLKPEMVSILQPSHGERAVSYEVPSDWDFTDWDELRERLVPGNGDVTSVL